MYDIKYSTYFLLSASCHLMTLALYYRYPLVYTAGYFLCHCSDVFLTIMDMEFQKTKIDICKYIDP